MAKRKAKLAEPVDGWGREPPTRLQLARRRKGANRARRSVKAFPSPRPPIVAGSCEPCGGWGEKMGKRCSACGGTGG